MPFLHGVTIVPLREVRSSAGVTTLVDMDPIPNCGFEPGPYRDAGQSSKTHAEVVSWRKLYTPPDTDLTAAQRVRFVEDGSVWEVVGGRHTGQFRSFFTGWTPGDAYDIKRVTPPS